MASESAYAQRNSTAVGGELAALRTDQRRPRCACPRPRVSFLAPGVVFVPIRARFVPISRILKSRPLNGPSRNPATVSTGEKSTGARRSEVRLLVTFVHDGGRLDGQTGCALYGSGPGHDPSPKIEKLIFGAPEVRTYGVRMCAVAIGRSKSALLHRSG